MLRKAKLLMYVLFYLQDYESFVPNILGVKQLEPFSCMAPLLSLTMIYDIIGSFSS